MKSIFGLKCSSYLLFATSDVGMHFHAFPCMQFLIKNAVRYFVVFWIFRLVVHLLILHDIVQCMNFAFMIVKVFLYFCGAAYTKLAPRCPVGN